MGLESIGLVAIAESAEVPGAPANYLAGLEQNAGVRTRRFHLYRRRAEPQHGQRLVTVGALLGPRTVAALAVSVEAPAGDAAAHEQRARVSTARSGADLYGGFRQSHVARGQWVDEAQLIVSHRVRAQQPANGTPHRLVLEATPAAHGSAVEQRAAVKQPRAERDHVAPKIELEPGHIGQGLVIADVGAVERRAKLPGHVVAPADDVAVLA